MYSCVCKGVRGKKVWVCKLVRYSVEAWWRERERATERWRWKERGSEARLGRERHHHRAVEDHRRRRNGESQNWRHHLNVLWSKKARGEGSSLLRGRGCQQKQKRAEFSWTSIGSITRVRYRSRRRRRSSFAQPKQSKRLRKMLTKLCAEWFIVARTYKFNIHSFFAVFIGPIAYVHIWVYPLWLKWTGRRRSNQLTSWADHPLFRSIEPQLRSDSASSSAAAIPEKARQAFSRGSSPRRRPTADTRRCSLPLHSFCL